MTRHDTRLIWVAAGAFVLAVLGANAHLAYVAISSQPACIGHVDLGEASATEFSAAKSSC